MTFSYFVIAVACVLFYLMDWRLAVLLALVLPDLFYSEDGTTYPYTLAFLLLAVTVHFIGRTKFNA